MTRHRLRAGVFMQAVVLLLSSAAPGTGSDTQPVERTPRAVLDLFHFEDKRLAPQTDAGLLRPTRHRLYLEVDGARAQAEDWLHTAGFFLFEQRDSEGRRSYQMMSGALADDWPTVQLHARVGGPQLSAGLQPRRDVPALGLTIPGKTYTLELEGLKDRRLGTALMAHLRWSDARRRIQYGIAVPVALGGDHSVGVLVQLRVSLDE